MFTLRNPPHLPPVDFIAVPHPPPDIKFYHPACTNIAGKHELVLSLQACDVGATPGTWGVYHDVALDACRIVANNEEGYLSTTHDAAGRVSQSTEVLVGLQYFYVVEGKSTPYPIVTSFKAWTFPLAIPPHWSSAVARPSPPLRPGTTSDYSQSNMAREVLARDHLRCVLTSYNFGLQCCHLVPHANASWYEANNMWQFTRHTEMQHLALGSSLLIHATGNGITLRSDIQQEFDRGVFAFVVKAGRVVCHVLQHLPQLEELYHNVPISVPSGVPPELLYARFAWALFKPGRKHGTGTIPVIEPPDSESKITTTSLRTMAGSQSSRSPAASITSINEGDESESMQVKGVQAMNDGGEEPEIYDDVSQRTLFFQRFPQLRQEVAYSDDYDWNTLAFHPDSYKMWKLSKDWKQKHSNIAATSGPTADFNQDDWGDVTEENCQEGPPLVIPSVMGEQTATGI